MKRSQYVKTGIWFFVFVNLIFWTRSLLFFTTPECLWKAVVGPNAREKKVIVYKVNSAYQGSPTDIRVLLPDSFDKNKTYRVLYILPTIPHYADVWWNSGLIEALKYDVANRYDVICVYPTFERMPWYADNPSDPRIRQESHFVRYVVPFVDAHFPTVRNASGRYLLGISKSGCGAFTLLLRYPELFGRALAWDAPLLYNNINAVKEAGTKEVFGTDANFRQYYLPNLLAEKAPLFKKGGARFILMGYGLLKDQMEQTHALMTQAGIPHLYSNDHHWDHKWQSGWMPVALETLLNSDRRLRIDQ